MTKESDEQEQRLLKSASLDELIKRKMEEELKTEIEKAKIIPKKETITDISKAPQNLIFSKNAVFKLFNRNTKTETYINGIQAESLLGMQNSTREKIKSGKIDAFSTEYAYIKFEKITQ